MKLKLKKNSSSFKETKRIKKKWELNFYFFFIFYNNSSFVIKTEKIPDLKNI